MLSRDKFIRIRRDSIKSTLDIGMTRYSEPCYVCPKCGGGMCKDNLSSYMIATLPPIPSDLFVCNVCGFEERIE